MTKDWESLFAGWASPPGAAEEQRCESTIAAIAEAIADSPKLKDRRVKIFAQGSFRNRVNVRSESDVDVGVMLYDSFLPRYPSGIDESRFRHSSAGYSYAEFKNDLETALVRRFGREAVVRGNKAFDIKARGVGVEADVAPFLEFRQYFSLESYRAGVVLIPDRTPQIENYPERLLSHWPATPLHYENGVDKNAETSHRFKGAVRILVTIWTIATTQQPRRFPDTSLNASLGMFRTPGSASRRGTTASSESWHSSGDTLRVRIHVQTGVRLTT